jgi:hypothetical protein
VVASDVGVERERLRDLRGGDPAVADLGDVAAVAHEEVDLAPGGVAEGGGDRRDRRRELGGRERPVHRPVFYLCP